MDEKKLFKNILKSLTTYEKGNHFVIDPLTLSESFKNIHLRKLLLSVDEYEILSIFNKDNSDSIKRWGRGLSKLSWPNFGIVCVVINQMMEVMNNFDNWDLGSSKTFSRLHKDFPNLKFDLMFFSHILKSGFNPFTLPYSREDMWECIHFFLLFHFEKMDIVSDFLFILDFCEEQEYGEQDYLMRRNIFYRLMIENDALI